MELKDASGQRLEDNGIYIGPDRTMGGVQIYRIKLSSDGNSFSAEYWDGSLKIVNMEENAKDFVKLRIPQLNLGFLEKCLEQ
jgi:hypothetical protein